MVLVWYTGFLSKSYWRRGSVKREEEEAVDLGQVGKKTHVHTIAITLGTFLLEIYACGHVVTRARLVAPVNRHLGFSAQKHSGSSLGKHCAYLSD